MIHWVAHEDGGLDIVDSCGAESHGGVCDTLVRIAATTKGNIEDLRALMDSAWNITP
jgi:hypothetical protein